MTRTASMDDTASALLSPCCSPGLCSFRPAETRRFVRAVRDLRNAGLDVSTNARSVLRPRSPDAHGRVDVYDEARYALLLGQVTTVMTRLQRSFRRHCCSPRLSLPCAECRETARALCPYAEDT